MSVSVSLAWAQGHGRAQADTGPQALPAAVVPLSFFYHLLVSQQHISQLFVQAMAAAGLGLRKSGKFRAKSSNQGWSPNSGQDAERETASLVDVLVSEQGQHSSSRGPHITRTTESASWLSDAVNLFCRSATEWFWFSTSLLGATRSRTQRMPLGQYQPAGNNETPLAREDLNSDAIVDAQLTHLISRDDAPQGQDTPNASDVPMPDALTVHDIATPRRTVGRKMPQVVHQCTTSLR